MKIMFGGSRALPTDLEPFVSQVVAASLERASLLHVACAAGADAMVLREAIAIAPSRVRLFCLGARSGRGFWRGSAPLSLLKSAETHGAQVTWTAGGSDSVTFAARLMRRSLAALEDCDVAFCIQ